MGDSLEAILPTDALFNALQNKADEVPDELMGLGIDITDKLVANVQDESPHDLATSISKQKNPKLTGNLAAGIRAIDNGNLSWIIAPDEGVSPYALFVILEGVSRDYPGNDFLQRGEDKTQPDIEDMVQQFENWCNDIDT